MTSDYSVSTNSSFKTTTIGKQTLFSQKKPHHLFFYLFISVAGVALSLVVDVQWYIVLLVGFKAGAAWPVSCAMTIFETIEAQLLWTHNLSTFYWIFHFSTVIYPVSCKIAQYTLPICGILLKCVEILVSSKWWFFFPCFCYRSSLDPLS